MKRDVRDKSIMVWVAVGAGIAVGLLAVAAIAVAGFSFLLDRGKADGAAAVSGSITGNCNANGVNNQIRCGPLGPSMAGIAVRERLDEMELWFDGLPGNLPAPPAELRGAGSSCRDEKLIAWFRTIDGLYFHDTSKIVALNAGEPDLVTVTAASVGITARKEVRPGEGTWIVCQWGGGGWVENHIIDIDTQTLRAALSDVPEGGPPGDARAMPPASLSLGDKSQALVSLQLTSRPGHVYSGVVSVTTSTNGKSSRLDIGDAQTPLRWMELPGLEEGGDYYALDATGTWVKNWRPY